MGAGGREAAGAPAGAGRARREGEWEAAAREARAAAGLAPAGGRAVTKAELAQHNSRESLWVALHG